MAEPPTLPPEVLALITTLVDSGTLKSLRLTNRTLCHLATRELFRVVSLYDQEESCQALKAIIPHAGLKQHVHKLYLNTVETEYVREILGSDDEDEIEPPHSWRELLSMLADLPNLQSVALRFDKHCAVDPLYSNKPQTELYRATVMEWLFAELASLRRPLKELGIQNYQNVAPPPGTTSDQINQVLSTLTSLRLNVVHERDEAAPEHDIDKDEPHQFFTRALPTHWLKPAMGSLQKLSLYSSLYWGFCPQVNLEGVRFPNLKSLTLGNFSFHDDKQLDWILSHSTLQELYLDDCPILFYITVFDTEDELSRCPIAKSDMQRNKNDDRRLDYIYPRRWHDYFIAIETSLPHLREFGFGINEAWDENSLPFEKEDDIVPALRHDRYMAFDSGIGPCQFMGQTNDPDRYGPEGQRPTCDDEDRDALKALYRRIGKQVDCGTFRIGDYITVENLVQTEGFPLY